MRPRLPLGIALRILKRFKSRYLSPIGSRLVSIGQRAVDEAEPQWHSET
jgi:hypothetical protein